MGEFADKFAAQKPSRQRAYLGSLLPNYVKSGNLEKYYQTLTDFNFLMAKIQHPEFGLRSLIDDFNLVDDSEAKTHPEYNIVKAQTLGLIGSLLWMSADILDRDQTQLAEQLFGRLSHLKTPEIKTVLKLVKQRKVAPWLRPLITCFTPPGSGVLRTIKGHRKPVNTVAVTVDGKLAISGSNDTTIKVWDLITGKEEFTLNSHSNWVNSVAVTADGKLAISGSRDKSIKVWDLTTGKEEFTLNGHNDWVNAVAITADGKRAISGSRDNIIKVWNLTTRKEQFNLIGHSKSVNAVAITADGKLAISASSDNTLKVWDLTIGKEEFTLNGHSDRINAVAITADCKWVISGSRDKTIKIWDLTTGKEQLNLTGHNNSVKAVDISADGKLVISASRDKTIKVWSLTTGYELFTLRGHSHLVKAVAITADGKRAISGSHDKTIKVWDLTTRYEQFTLRGHSHLVKALATTPDGKRAISGSHDQTIKVWNLKTGKEEFTLNGHSDWVNALAVTIDGKLAISASSDKTIKIWDLTYSRGLVIKIEERQSKDFIWDDKTKGRLKEFINFLTLRHRNEEFTLNDHSNNEEFTLNGHSNSVNAIAVTFDSKLAISGSNDKTIKVWNLTTRKQLFTLNGHSDSVNAVAVTADGKWALSGSSDNTLKVWDLINAKELFTLKGHSDKVNAVAITTNGNRAISGSSDNTIKVWNLINRDELLTLKGHNNSVNAVAIAANSRRAISGSSDNTLKVWDLSSGNMIASFTGESSISSCAIAPDGVTIVAGDRSGRVYFLRLEKIKKLRRNNINPSPLATPISTDSYPKEFQQLLQEKTDKFTDRKFVFSAISDFLDSHSRGYFTIVGTPGSGKSSILAQYVTAHPRCIYYNAEVAGKNRSPDFLASACTQLIDKYLALNSETSEILNLKAQIQNIDSDDGSWFLSLLLQKISDLLPANQKLIVVIDSLDAIDPTSQPPFTNLFYLPRYLSDRTYFILARRPFLKEKSGLLIEAPSQTLDLRDYPAQNREDALNYIQQYSSIAPASSEQIATMGDNNFMYLSQILPAIADRSQPDANLGEMPSLLSEIPPGLAAYYQNHWQRMGGDSLSAVELAVLKVLVQGRSNLSVSAISEIVDEDEYEIEKVLDNWYEFLNLQQIDGEICYSFYHSNFRDWIGRAILKIAES